MNNTPTPGSMAFIQKWAAYFAVNGTGYAEHLSKDIEAALELDAYIATATKQARREALIALHGWVMKASDPIARQNLFKYVDEGLAALDGDKEEK